MTAKVVSAKNTKPSNIDKIRERNRAKVFVKVLESIRKFKNEFVISVFSDNEFRRTISDWDVFEFAYECCHNGNFELFKFFVGQLDKLKVHFNQLLNDAVDNNALDIVKYLVKNKLVVELQDSFETAIIRGDKEAIDILIKGGISKKTIKEGFVVACSKGNLDVVNFLEGKIVNFSNKFLEECLYNAMRGVYKKELVAKLLKKSKKYKTEKDRQVFLDACRIFNDINSYKII